MGGNLEDNSWTCRREEHGSTGTHEDKLEYTTTSWNPCLPLTTLNFLQKELVSLVHMHLVQESEKLRENQVQKLEELRAEQDERVNQQNYVQAAMVRSTLCQPSENGDCYVIFC